MSVDGDNYTWDNLCPKCGKPTVFIGDRGSATEQLMCTCAMPKQDVPTYGWICPVCHRVNAPWRDQCKCSGGWTVTYVGK